jgi:HK97 family phage prohead protease
MTTDSMPVWRTQKFANLTLSGVTGEGRFSGYASIFGEVDLGKDAIAPGAFQQSLARRGASGVRMLFQHDPGEPLGAWKTIREDARGLYVEGLLSPGVARAQEVHMLMKAGALDGLSIGFQTVKAKDRRQDRRAPHPRSRSLGNLDRHLSDAAIGTGFERQECAVLPRHGNGARTHDAAGGPDDEAL